MYFARYYTLRGNFNYFFSFAVSYSTYNPLDNTENISPNSDDNSNNNNNTNDNKNQDPWTLHGTTTKSINR